MLASKNSSDRGMPTFFEKNQFSFKCTMTNNYLIFFFRKKETLLAYFIFGIPSKLPLGEEPGQTGNIYG